MAVKVIVRAVWEKREGEAGNLKQRLVCRTSQIHEGFIEAKLPLKFEHSPLSKGGKLMVGLLRV